MVQPQPDENAPFASTRLARPWLRESRKMSKSTQVDPLAVHSFRAMLIDGTGKRAYAAPVSINIASLVLETKDTVRDAARQMQEKAKAAFESSVLAASSTASFAVKGLPDREIQLSDIFMLTMGRAITSVVTCVAKGQDVGNIACTGLQVSDSCATITLTDPEVQSSSAIKLKRGPGLGTLSEEVRVSCLSFRGTCLYMHICSATSAH
jgi:hypothetical protein